MIPSGTLETNHFVPDNSPIIPPPGSSGSIHGSFQSFQLGEFLTNFSNNHALLEPQVLTPDSSCTTMIDEGKKRRLISNRESARRSRKRKQYRMLELRSTVLLLKTQNHFLIDKLNRMSKDYDRVLAENALLQKEASELHKMVANLQEHVCFA